MHFDMKRVIVTGGSGFVGANLVRRLISDGHEVHLLMRPGFQRWRVEEILQQVRVHELDMLQYETLEAIVRSIRPDWIFHLAAHGAYSWQDDFKQILDTNLHSTIHLVQACVGCGFEAFVHAGSSSEYGLKDHAPSESEAVVPNSHYAVAKAAATLYCQFVARRDHAPITTLRLYSAYGPYEEARRLVPNLILKGLQGAYPPLVSPDTARDYVFVDDVVEGLLAAALSANTTKGEIYNLGSGKQTSLLEMVETVRQVLSINEKPVWGSMTARAWDTSVWVANPTKAAQDLNWRAITPLSEGLLQTAEWFRKLAPAIAELYQREVFSK